MQNIYTACTIAVRSDIQLFYGLSLKYQYMLNSEVGHGMLLSLVLAVSWMALLSNNSYWI